ncbi:hypothetical protein Bca101_001573 [Brassica carinata]
MKAARLGSEEVTSPDSISHLPDDLLLRILSLLPVRTAMSTSLLSKRWKPVWKMMPMLVYDETCPYIGSLGFDLFCGVSLPLHEALKTLNLKLGKYSDSIDTLLFPNIVPPLHRLSITSEPAYYGSDEPRLEISTPCLNYLKIFDRCGYYNFLEDMPKLVEADVSVDMSKNENLLRVLSSVEHLVICLYPSMVLDLTDSLIFNQLLHLELDVCNSFRSNLLLSFLKYFPNLQSLKLGRTYPEDTEDQLYCLGSEPSSVPKCLSFHLENIQWTGYGGTLDEREATATIRLQATCMDDGQIIMKDVTSMSKASASCQLVIE